MDPTTRLVTSDSLDVEYCDVDNLEDFNVLRLQCGLAARRDWKTGARCKSLIDFSNVDRNDFW